ncbi:MAG: YbaN family protein, partial [Bacteroidota bacterium]
MKAVKRTENRFLRAILRILGILFVGLGITGIIVPILPATPFFLLAAWCFMKSSERLYRWLMTNRIFGKYLKNYTEGKGIPLKIKVGVLTLLWLMIGYVVLFIFGHILIRIILLAIAVAVTIHITRIKTL